MGKFLNGVNSVMDLLLVQKFTGAVNSFARHATASTLCFFLSFFQKKDEVEDGADESLSSRLELAFATGTTPIGIFAACAGLNDCCAVSIGLITVCGDWGLKAADYSQGVKHWGQGMVACPCGF